MRLAAVMLLNLALCCTAELTIRRKHETEVSKTAKRELLEGNAGIKKRTVVLPTAAALGASTPGIQYADTTESLPDKSPPQQIYATPVPHIAKISDLLSGQGPPFSAAIANHLYSPVSVYQTKLGSPTTYEVSPPIPSELAYSEHKVALQPQNAIQYSQQPFEKLQARANSQQLTINYQSPDQNQIFLQNAPLLNQQHYKLPFYQSNVQQNQLQKLYQEQQPQVFSEIYIPRLTVSPSQPGIVYARQEEESALQYEDTKRPSNPVQSAKQTLDPQQNYAKQGAVSYASFSQSQPPSTLQNYPANIQQQPELPPPSSNSNIKSLPRPFSYFRTGFDNQPFFQSQLYPQQSLHDRPNYSVHSQPAVSPTFPPVQYFGKYAQSIFQNYQH